MGSDPLQYSTVFLLQQQPGEAFMVKVVEEPVRETTVVDVLLGSITALQQGLVASARANQTAVLPGYTHLQRAQPVTFAHWALAYVEMLERDYSRLQDALKRLDTSPLGCGGNEAPYVRCGVERTAPEWLRSLVPGCD